MRCFVAIDLPDDVTERLLAVRPAPGPGIRPVPREQMHVTVLFLGDQDPDAVREALLDLRIPAFFMTIGGLGHFEGRTGAHILWAGVTPTPALLEARAAVVDAMSDIGFDMKEEDYRPHVTLARVRIDRAGPLAPFLLPSLPPQTVEVTELVHFTSELGPDGPLYRKHAVVPLLRLS
ncbi:MAG: RNA 2',3'-cyclic phosphodiesterase [Alphaproteobacteria bacterium]|nr:RNA 2',3'-cyclic phosphodiesterase [Alphaproteobacteria bacterium]